MFRLFASRSRRVLSQVCSTYCNTCCNGRRDLCSRRVFCISCATSNPCPTFARPAMLGKMSIESYIHPPPPARQFIGHCHPYAGKSASQAVLSRVQLTLHATRRTPHGSLRFVLAMSAWSVKTRRAPSRHCRDARVYGHTTTAMLDNEYTPLARSAPAACPLFCHSAPRRTVQLVNPMFASRLSVSDIVGDIR